MCMRVWHLALNVAPHNIFVLSIISDIRFIIAMRKIESNIFVGNDATNGFYILHSSVAVYYGNFSDTIFISNCIPTTAVLELNIL